MNLIDPVRWSRRSIAGVVVLVVVAVTLAGCATGSDAVNKGSSFQFISPGGKVVISYDPPSSRQTVRDVSGTDLLTGRALRLNEFAGRVVVINVWASWCAPCRLESTELEQVYSQTSPMGSAFLGIDFRDDRETARDFVLDRKMTYPSLFDYPGRSLAALTTPTSVVPTTIVLDRKHRVAKVYLRSIRATELGPEVVSLLREPVIDVTPTTGKP
jgi:thiol-disulfide isomerase/thioredoxin